MVFVRILFCAVVIVFVTSVIPLDPDSVAVVLVVVLLVESMVMPVAVHVLVAMVSPLSSRVQSRVRVSVSSLSCQ